MPFFFLGITFHKDSNSFDWEWYDWLGVVAILVGLSFFVAIISAIWRGENPLKILEVVSQSIGTIFGRSPK